MVSRKNLLLVDPFPAEQKALVDALFASGYEVKSAVNAAEAKVLLRDFQPDLLLSEVQLSGDEDGLGLVESLKGQASFAAVPVILYGQSPSLPQRIRGLELGVADFLEKPLYLKEILSRIQLLLEKQALQPAPTPAPKTQGALADENLLQLLRRLLQDHLSGLLELRSETQRGQVWLHEGEVLDARIGALRGERALNRLFLWSQGEFDLQTDAPLVTPSIELPTKSLLFEGQRRQKEWDRLLPSLPSLQNVLEIDETKRNQRTSIIPDDLEMVLGLCDGKRDLQQVIEESGLDEVAALELCSRLYGNGMLRAPIPAGAATPRNVPEAAPIPSPRRLEVTTTPPRPVESNEAFAWGGANAADTIIEPAPRFSDPGMPTGNSAAVDFPATELPASNAQRWARNEANPQDTLIDDAPMLASDLLPDALSEPSPTMQATVSFRAPQEEVSSATQDSFPHASNASSKSEDPAGKMDEGNVAGGSEPAGDEAFSPLASRGQPEGDGAESVENAPAWFEAKAGGARNQEEPATDEVGGSENHDVPQSVSAESSASEPQEDIRDDAPSIGDESVSAGSGAEPQNDGVHMESPQQPAEALANANTSAHSAQSNSNADGGTPHAERHASENRHDSPRQEPVEPMDGSAQREISATWESSSHQASDSAPQAADAEPSETSEGYGSEHKGDDAADSFLPRDVNASLSSNTSMPSSGVDDVDDELIDEFNSGKQFGMVVGGGLLVVLLLALLYALFNGRTDESAHRDAGVPSTSVNDESANAAPASEVEVDPPAPPAPSEPAAREASPAPTQASEKRERKTRKARPARGEKNERKELQKREQAPATNAGQEPKSAQPKKPNAQKEDEIYTEKLKEAEKLSKQSNFRDAIAAYLAALEVRSNSGDAHLGLGNAYYEVNEVKNAIRHLEKAKALLRKDPQVFVLLGAVYQTANRTKDAENAYERYLELAPNGRYARDVKNLLIGLKGQ